MMLLFNVAPISVHPKATLDGGGVFNEEERKSAMLQITYLIIGHDGKRFFLHIIFD